MLGFKPKTDEVLNHWIAFAEGFSLSPQEFYASVEQEIAANKLPGLDISRVDYREGGLLSDKRIYLRMIRERLAFDICAAPFGTRYFFSCRTVYSPAVIKFWHILVIIMFFGAIYYPLFVLLGLVQSLAALAGLLLAIALTMRNAVAMGLADLDTTLLKTPAVGPIYERWFRINDAYYREDTRYQYLDAVSGVVKKLAEDATGTKGIKLMRQYERAPVLGELYKPSPPRREDTP